MFLFSSIFVDASKALQLVYLLACETFINNVHVQVTIKRFAIVFSHMSMIPNGFANTLNSVGEINDISKCL